MHGVVIGRPLNARAQKRFTARNSLKEVLLPPHPAIILRKAPKASQSCMLGMPRHGEKNLGVLGLGGTDCAYFTVWSCFPFSFSFAFFPSVKPMSTIHLSVRC